MATVTYSRNDTPKQTFIPDYPPFLFIDLSDQRRQFLHIYFSDPFLVEPFRFFKVKPGTCLMYPVDAELFNKLTHRINFLFASVVPSEDSKHICKRFR